MLHKHSLEVRERNYYAHSMNRVKYVAKHFLCSIDRIGTCKKLTLLISYFFRSNNALYLRRVLFFYKAFLLFTYKFKLATPTALKQSKDKTRKKYFLLSRSFLNRFHKGFKSLVTDLLNNILARAQTLKVLIM